MGEVEGEGEGGEVFRCVEASLWGQASCCSPHQRLSSYHREHAWALVWQDTNCPAEWGVGSWISVGE